MSLEISDGLSMLALLLSVWASIQAHRVNKKMISLQEPSANLATAQLTQLQKEEQERKIPRVSAYCYYGDSNSLRIAVRNTGHVPALNVSFCFNHDAASESPEITGILEDLFPIATLIAGREVNFPIAPSSETADAWPVKISWESEDGLPYQENLNLSENAS